MPIVSLVIPAHNEEAVIEATLRAAFDAVRSLGSGAEVIVVDDASTDRTAEIAGRLGARVVSVSCRNIGGARNAGARVSRGDILIFVDADTLVTPAVVAAVVAAVQVDGAVAGGAPAHMDEAVPAWGRVLVNLVARSLRPLKWAAGCFLFARREVFERVGGFDERYFASEEIHLSRALKKHGRFVVVPEWVTTSGRKFRLYSTWELVGQFLLVAVHPGRLKRRATLDLWYGGRRESPRTTNETP